MAKIITIANQKGGVGKTTSCMNLGVALSRSRKRVLLIDSDPQANLTSYLGVAPGRSPHENLMTLDELYLSKRPWDASSRSKLITRTDSGPDLIASDAHLTGVEHYLYNRPDREAILGRFLDAMRADYDFILIDTPPSLNLLTLNALCASDHVVIPVQPEFFSLEGIVKIRGEIQRIQERWNPKLTILGILPTQVSHRRKLTEEVLSALKQELGNAVFESLIHDNSSVAESSGHGKSVLEYDQSSKGARDYLAASKELLKRSEAH